MTPSQTHDNHLFVLAVNYITELSEVDVHMDAHRAWLDENYASGLFMVSGPQVPRRGGVILARAADRSAIEETIRRDPFVLTGVARYDITEFAPTRGPYAAQPWRPETTASTS